MRTPQRPLALGALLVLACLSARGVEPTVGSTEGGVVLQAMRDELARSMDKLHMEGMERPYFMAYQVADVEESTAVAHFGALIADPRGMRGKRRERTLTVEVRVGDRDLDNTNFMPTRPSGRRLRLPLDDNYRELRRRIWLATDAAYKNALERLAKKRAALQSRTREEALDFGAASPAEVFGAVPPSPEDGVAFSLARDLSRVFKAVPDVDDSRVEASSTFRRVYYVNSEGSAFVRHEPSVYVGVEAKTQAVDGMVLQDFEAFHGYQWDDLPNREAMIRRVRALGETLAARREAEFVDRYSGPVLFEGQAAAELFAQAMAPRLLATRVPISERSNMDSSIARLRNPFLDKVGARILPRFLDVRDDPTLAEYRGRPLFGGYSVDDDGVPAAPTVLVENGILKTLLSTRNPVPGVAGSTGSRRGGGARPSNLLITTAQGLNAEELRNEFVALVRERGNDFGIVVRRLGNPSAKLDRTDFPTSNFGQVHVERLVRAYKVYPDGREALIGKAELSGVSEATFKEIVAASDTATVYTLLRLWAPSASALEYATARYGYSLANTTLSIAVPDLLFEEMTVRKPTGNLPRPPVARHPFFDKS